MARLCRGNGRDSIDFYTRTWLSTSQDQVVLRQIIYERQEQQGWIRSLVEPALARLDGLADERGRERARELVPELLRLCQEELAECFFCFKHPKFSEEQEWRVVYRPVTRESHAEMPRRLFRTRGNLIVPYVELALPASDGEYAGKLPIFSVMIGPTAHPELATKSVVMLLQDAGYSDPVGVQ